MATRRIREFLIGNKIPFSSISHTSAYTAQEVAELSHVPGRYMAKVVVVWMNGRLAIVVVPATKAVDLEKLRRDTGFLDARLAEESEFRDRFVDCQVGTVPPFGNLFGLETLVDQQLTTAEQIAFNAGTHRDVIVIRYSDYEKLVRARVVDVAGEARDGAARNKARHVAKPGARTRSEEELPAPELALQAECGCQVMHHQGAD